jgi:hypothetical protein
VAAAWWLGLWPDPPSIMVLTVPQRFKRAAQRGVRLRRRDLGAVDRVEANGLWTTTVPLTVLDSAVELGRSGSRLLDRALQRAVDFDSVYRAHCAGLGRAGSAVAADLLRAAGDRAASEAERALIALLRRSGLTGWKHGYRVGMKSTSHFPNTGSWWRSTGGHGTRMSTGSAVIVSGRMSSFWRGGRCCGSPGTT